MTRTMQAAQVEQFRQPLVLKELDIPTPGARQLLVKTEACGVCHTDLHAASGDWPLKRPLPFTPRHEGMGIVTALGAGVTAVKEGDRVGVPWRYSTCGHCEFCLAAQEPVCAQSQFGGYTKHGGFAEYIVADPAPSSATGATWPKPWPSSPTARVKADIELHPLTAINAVFERLAKGGMPSRVVLGFAG